MTNMDAVILVAISAAAGAFLGKLVEGITTIIKTRGEVSQAAQDKVIAEQGKLIETLEKRGKKCDRRMNRYRVYLERFIVWADNAHQILTDKGIPVRKFDTTGLDLNEPEPDDDEEGKGAAIRRAESHP